jgi:hypothetical protein
MVAAPARCSLEYDLVNAPTVTAPGGRWPTRETRQRGGVGPACTVTVDRGSVASAYVVPLGVRRAPGGGAHTLLVLRAHMYTVHGAP